MKVAVIIYHKNALNIYPQKWIDLCISSIVKQTYNQFDIFELDYAGEGNRLVSDLPVHMGYTYLNEKCVNFVEGMNKLLNLVFRNYDYDCCFNVNLDDYYSLDRFEKQITAIRQGYDLVSSDIAYIDEDNEIIKFLRFSNLNMRREMRYSNNVIAHPVVCYSRRFWLNCPQYDINAIPEEDMQLWKRTIARFKFHIVPEFLCFHRIHSNKVCANPNNR